MRLTVQIINLMQPKTNLHRVRTVLLYTLLAITVTAQVPSNKPDTTTVAPPPTQTVNPVPTAYPSGMKVNYIRTWEPLEPFTNDSLIKNYSYNPTLHTNAVKTGTVYFDGLGRKLQSVQRMGSAGLPAGARRGRRPPHNRPLRRQ